MKNIGLKLLSLTIALILAIYVHSASNTSVRTFVSSVDLKRVPQGKIVISPLNPSVQVTVKGPSYIVSGIVEAPPVFKIVLPNISGNRFSLPLDQAALAIPSHVEVLNIDPPQFDFVLDNIVDKAVPVALSKIGLIGNDLKIQEITLSQEKISVTGPEGELDNLINVETEPLDLRDVKGDMETELPLKPVGSLVQLSISKVKARVKTAPIMAQKRFEHVPIELRAKPGARFSVAIKDVNVLLSGPRSEIDKLSSTSILAYVRVPDDTVGSFIGEIGIERPIGIEIVEFEPRVAKVTASILKSSELTSKSKDGRK